jgi:hypothetical protein
MNPRAALLLSIAIRPALGLLEPRMQSREAEAQVLAIALQESGLRHRVQQDGDANEYDDALSFWQFERIGVAEVLRHAASARHAADLCARLGYPAETEAVYRAIRDNDVLAAGFARLALWRHPAAMPSELQRWPAWQIYLDVWRPGKQNPDQWQGHYLTAWETVKCLS